MARIMFKWTRKEEGEHQVVDRQQKKYEDEKEVLRRYKEAGGAIDPATIALHMGPPRNTHGLPLLLLFSFSFPLPRAVRTWDRQHKRSAGTNWNRQYHHAGQPKNSTAAAAVAAAAAAAALDDIPPCQREKTQAWSVHEPENPAETGCGVVEQFAINKAASYR